MKKLIAVIAALTLALCGCSSGIFYGCGCMFGSTCSGIDRGGCLFSGLLHSILCLRCRSTV